MHLFITFYITHVSSDVGACCAYKEKDFSKGHQVKSGNRNLRKKAVHV
jgi:hypothetical protein